MKPWIHSKSSAKKYGGKPEDYLDIHQFMDSSKAALADVRHRALLHSSFGCFIAEQLFGVIRKNSAGKEYSPRDVAEDHCIEDLGFIPSVEKWLGNMKIEQWMGGPCSNKDKGKFIPLNNAMLSNTDAPGVILTDMPSTNTVFSPEPKAFEYFDGNIRDPSKGTEVTELPKPGDAVTMDISSPSIYTEDTTYFR